jgi:cytochrome c5
MNIQKRLARFCAATFTTAAALLLLTACPPTRAPFAGHLFVHGTVVAVLGASRATKTTTQVIALPHANVFLIPPGDRAHPVASTVSDLSGRFILKTLKRGAFELCVEAEGFAAISDRPCNPLRLETASVSLGDVPVKPKTGPNDAAVFGTLRLRDGHLPRGFYPMLGINAFVAAELLPAGGAKRYRAFIHNLGEYVIPQLPVKNAFTIEFKIDTEVLKRDIDPISAMQPGGVYELSEIFPNSAPRIRALTAMAANGKPVQVAALGSQVSLHAVADDPDGDALDYRWILPDAPPVGPTTSPDLSWTVPNSKQRYAITVVVSDRRGGYTQNGIIIDAASERARFSGTVVDPDGHPIENAQIDVNGRLIATNSSGWFGFDVPIADRYVTNIRKPGLESTNLPSFGTASVIYRSAVPAGRWTLRRAEVTTVDPTKAIVLTQRKRDCPRLLSGRIDWSPYVRPGLFDWQDGRGNSRALVDVARDAKRAQNIARMLARTSPALASTFANLTRVRAEIEDRQPNCGPGIQVEIPPNSLEDSNHVAPTGNVQIALSSVALTVGDQMPGDYTVQDSGGHLSAMESFGAGSIEIGDGAKRYNLKPGASGTLTIPVDGTQLAGRSTTQSTMSLLYYDEQQGVWHPEGNVTLRGSGANSGYAVKVKHFSTANADILKTGQSCVAIEVDSSLSSNLPFQVEMVMQPSKPNPGVIQVRQNLTVDSLRTNAIFNLPNDSDIVLTPIISGTLPDGSSGNVPAGVFVVNTGGPQVGSGAFPPPNPDGTYYAEAGGVATGPCASRVTLKKLNPPVLNSPDEFLQGFSFQSSNITEFDAGGATPNPTIVTNIEAGATAYYHQADPRDLRATFNLFKSKNRFGTTLASTEVEQDVQYANSGDLGFGRDMHCRRNVGSDGAFDYACYVTNFGQPPLFLPDQQDADDIHDPTKADATVAIEFSRVENLPGDPNEFADNVRAVKFFVYDTKNPNSNVRILKADLDGHGARPVPQLCMVCHGGNLASVAADPANPTGPKAGAFADATDIKSMRANFLPFDLHLYNFPVAKSKASQQAAFKTLNTQIVKGVDAATTTGAAIVEIIDSAFYPGAATDQNEDTVVPGWDPANLNSNPHKLYQNVIARACRTCHTAQPFGAPPFNTQAAFDAKIPSVQEKACTRKIMPHAQRTNDVFWQSLNPNMAAYLELYGQTVSGWTTADAAQCGLFFQPGTTAVSQFQSQILPILQVKCGSCHSNPGNANFGVSQAPATVYNELLNTLAKDGTSKYIVPNNSGASKLYQRISGTAGGIRMPQGGPPYLDTTDTVPGGLLDEPAILDWINTGAPGP